MTDISADLQAFIAEAPAARAPHVRFLVSAIADLPAGSRILAHAATIVRSVVGLDTQGLLPISLSATPRVPERVSG